MEIIALSIVILLIGASSSHVFIKSVSERPANGELITLQRLKDKLAHNQYILRNHR